MMKSLLGREQHVQKPPGRREQQVQRTDRKPVQPKWRDSEEDWQEKLMAKQAEAQSSRITTWVLVLKSLLNAFKQLSVMARFAFLKSLPMQCQENIRNGALLHRDK